MKQPSHLSSYAMDILDCLWIGIVDSNLMIPVELTYHSPLLHPYALSHGNKYIELLSWLFL
ncbi:hypothetical protein COLO4_00127 [Corchorus olitorius]|uniref:Uncharacterized protein n=1 Tax=Corchorus olitorius TaxID=93759 RepID=A0A1R3L4I9_9ROSI|nr:hypothetical protein COLO4_00127 [Corchorus olitorius]